MKAIQDLYADDFSHCFGCGNRNPRGHRLQSYAKGTDVVAYFTPQPEHMSVPGFVYGGLLASLVDCHAMAAAAARFHQDAGLSLEEGPVPRFVTAALRVNYLKPTPLGPELEIRGTVVERSEKKAVVKLTIATEGMVTVEAEVVAVRMPKSME
jgi:acyl-coenzyme A thioesterase PaaI-like protein